MAKAIPTISKEEQEWRAEDDARTLTQAEEIKADKARYARAKKKLRQNAKDAITAAEKAGVRLRGLKPRK